MIVSILTENHIYSSYRFYGARHSNINVGYKIDFDNFDTIYVMDKNNYSHLISLSSNAQERNKIRLILNEIDPKSHDSVPDPYYDNNGFKMVYNLLNEACKKIAIKIE